MHFLPFAVFCLVFKLSVICAFGGPRRFLFFIKDCLTVGEDTWTWTTCTGEWFEDAEIESIEQGELVLKHRYGVVCVAIDRLSERSRDLLFNTQRWADHLAGLPSDEKISTFVHSPVAQAA